MRSIFELKNDEKEILTSSSIGFDTRKTLNRSEEKMPEELIKRIEKEGITIEEIKRINAPIYLYKGQITIHGDFSLIHSEGYLNSYKSLILNQNKSLGVKYNAIDLEKKKKIKKSISLNKDKFWRVYTDSNSFIINSSILVTKENLIEVKEKSLLIFKSIPDNFIGDKYSYFFNLMGQYFLSIEIKVSAIYEKDLFDFISFFNPDIKDEDSFKEKERVKEEENKIYWENFRKESEEREIEKNKIFLEEKEILLKEKKNIILEELPNKDEFYFTYFYNSYDGIKIVLNKFFKKRGKSYLIKKYLNNWSEIKEIENESYNNKKILFSKESNKISKMIKNNEIYLVNDFSS